MSSTEAPTQERPSAPSGTITLPANSFTASRFLYGTVEEISAASQVVLLGGLPSIWYREQKNNLLRSWAKKTYSELRHGLDELNSRSTRLGLTDISHDLRSRKLAKMLKRLPDSDDEDDEYEDDHDNDDDDDNDDKRHNSIAEFYGTKNLLGPEIGLVRTETEMDVLSPEGRFDIDDASLRDDNGDKGPKGPTHVQASRSLRTDENEQYFSPSAVSTTTTSRSFYTADEPYSGRSQPSITTLKSPTQVQRPNQPIHACGQAEEHSPDETISPGNTIISASAPSTGSTISRPSEGPLREMLTHPTITVGPESDLESDNSHESHPKVRFNAQEPQKRTTSRINAVRPSPANVIDMESLDSRRELAMEKMKTVASMTKRRVRKDIKRVRQKQLYKRFAKNFFAGEIVKMEKMLVLVKTPAPGTKVSGFSHFTEIEPCDTRVLERWKEYIVVARSSGDIEEPVLLQFYTTREIPDTADSKHSKDQLDFALTKDCSVGFYSTLDRTISLVKDDKIFILRCQTPTSSVRWFTFFNEILGVSSPHVISVEIPTLKLAINLNLGRSFYDKLFDYKFESVIIDQKDRGYHLHKQPIVQALSSKLKNKLISAGYGGLIEKFESTEEILGVCWRYYDRLEWLFGETLGNLFFQQAMHFTHQLEFRYLKHYSRTVEDETLGNIMEPAPIEGFLLRLTTKEGNLRRGLFNKQVFGFNYFKTCDNLIFFSSYFKAIPPLPFNDTFFDLKYVSNKNNFKEISFPIPQVYHHNPFTLDENNHISWMKPGMTPEEFQKHDFYGLYDFERRVNLIKGADNVLDLLEVDDISEYDAKDIPVAVETASRLLWSSSIDLHHRKVENRDTYFQILMKNGCLVVLKAHSSAVKDEWISRLKALKLYWEKRVSKDNDLIRSLRDINAEKLNMDGSTEGNFEMSPKWEATRGEARPEIFNITPYAMFRPIIRSGFLFQKPKKHATFRKYFVVTVPGFILLYKVVARGATGQIKSTTHYTHYITIPLAECYIYSGPICGLDLLNREADVDTIRPGKTLLPRVYEDGWLSSDDEASRCFTLWFGQKRAIAGKSLQKSNELGANYAANPSLIRMVSRLGVTGKSMVFMCRSRQERDLWVSNLYTELERFGKANER